MFGKITSDIVANADVARQGLRRGEELSLCALLEKSVMKVLLTTSEYVSKVLRYF